MRYKWATGYWQEIIKNTASNNQSDNEFKIISKLKQWLRFGRSFIIVMGSIIIFHYKECIIYWKKMFFKSIYILYSFNPSSSSYISKHLFYFKDFGHYSSILTSKQFLCLIISSPKLASGRQKMQFSPLYESKLLLRKYLFLRGNDIQWAQCLLKYMSKFH